MIFNSQVLEYHSNPSKSYLHRYLILTSFIEDSFCIENISLNNDIKETIDVLTCLGKDIKIHENKIVVNGSKECKKVEEVYIKESGSTLRLLLPLLAYFDVKKIVVGKRLSSRPIDLYYPFIDKKEDNIIYLKHGKMNEIDGSVSSQFVSGLLIYNAIINNKNKLVVKNKIVSKNYIEITFDVLSKFGFIFNDFTLVKKDKHINNIVIEDDYSSAINYVVYGLLKNGIILNNLNEHSLQGDKKVVDIFKDYIEFKEDKLIVKKCNNEPINVDIEDIIDCGPILFVYALFSNGISTFKNVNRLKDKESNRLNAMLSNFDLLGVSYKLKDNELSIKGSKEYPFINGLTYNDHRIAMSLIVFGLINENGINVDDLECIKKSNLNFII